MVLQRFDHQKVIDYFWESGVMSKERDGYYYPLSGQAASVRAMLEREMDRYKVEVHCDETLQRIIRERICPVRILPVMKYRRTAINILYVN